MQLVYHKTFSKAIILIMFEHERIHPRSQNRAFFVVFVSDGILTDTDTASVTINNVPPSVDAGPDGTINEGETFLGSGSFTDPSADTWTATVNYGDNTGDQALALNPDKTFDLNHQYPQDGTFIVKVGITDDDDGYGEDKFTVTANNVIPTVIIAASNATISEGDVWTANGLFTDPGADAWTATVDYGDDSGIMPLALGHKQAGLYITRSKSAYWDGRNESGESIKSGIYFYNIRAGEYTATGKMLIQK